jgi:beta-glucanase (GH16 family)
MRPRSTGAALAVALLVAQPLGCNAHAREGAVISGPLFEDFLGPAGARPDPNHWTIDVGPSSERGWERGSLQTYTDSPDNIRLDGFGNLVIEARKVGEGYTSARVVTRGKLSFPLGTIAARIKFPAGQGLWPAFWMLGADIDTVGWPQCGEIDIMEIVNTASTYNIAMHGPGADVEKKGSIDDLSQDYHSYWVTRRADSVTVGIDTTAMATFTRESHPPGAPWVFDGPMFALLNLAVGGDWPGPPDASTPFPSAMIVDWFSFTPLSDSQSQE